MLAVGESPIDLVHFQINARFSQVIAVEARFGIDVSNFLLCFIYLSSLSIGEKPTLIVNLIWE